MCWYNTVIKYSRNLQTKSKIQFACIWRFLEKLLIFTNFATENFGENIVREMIGPKNTFNAPTCCLVWCQTSRRPETLSLYSSLWFSVNLSLLFLVNISLLFSLKSWMCYIFTAVCLCVCFSVRLSVCVWCFLVNKLPAEQM